MNQRSLGVGVEHKARAVLGERDELGFVYFELDADDFTLSDWRCCF